jgi:hypothetical protein
MVQNYQGGQMRLCKNRPKRGPTRFLSKVIHNFYFVKRSPKVIAQINYTKELPSRRLELWILRSNPATGC